MQELYKVYMCSFKNGKAYIGVSKNYESRKKDHIKSAKNKNGYRFHKALLKYNFDAEWSILKSDLTKEDAIKAEIRLIELYETHASTGKGYNLTLGGDGVVGMEVQRKSKLKRNITRGIRAIEVYDLVGNLLSVEDLMCDVCLKYKITQSKAWLCLSNKRFKTGKYRLKYVGSEFNYIKKPRNVGRKGEKRSTQACMNISKALTGKKASAEHRANMSKGKKGKSIKSKGVPKSVSHLLSSAKTRFNASLVVYKDGSYVGTFSSVLEASIELKLKNQSISACLVPDSKRSTLHGYSFIKEINHD